MLFQWRKPLSYCSSRHRRYVIIDKELKWDGVDIGITIPKWMKIKAFNHGALVKYNDNDRTIKIVIKKGDNQ